jgi:O-acetyl-ADP-ribose deacetylase (regulator of RNase III)
MIRYVTGDATRPQADGDVVIAHVCNDIGKWGKGFVLALSRRWTEPERDYLEWIKGSSPYLGDTKIVRVEPTVWVANMIAQSGVRSASNPHPLNYVALGECLSRVGNWARYKGASVHMPRIGCGLAGGTWDKVEQIILKELAGLDVFVYDLP